MSFFIAKEHTSDHEGLGDRRSRRGERSLSHLLLAPLARKGKSCRAPNLSTPPPTSILETGDTRKDAGSVFRGHFPTASLPG